MDNPTSPTWARWQAQIDTLRATITQRVGRQAHAAVERHARIDVLDTLGCALAGRAAPEVAALEAQFCELEPVDPARAFRFPGGSPLSARAATQVLAIAPTWFEACEGHAAAHGRPGIATMAALLPLAMQRNLTLGQFIDAFALGYEVGARCGAWLRLAPGVHADGNWPVLGVACATAALLGMDGERIGRAMDIAACRLASSLYLPIRTGRSVRNVYLAHCASSGIDAALQARAGIDAPPDALGYYAEHYIPAAPEALPGPGIDMLLDAYQKPFAAVRHVHYGAIAAQRIREQLGAQVSQIGDIELEIYEEAIAYCNNPQPQTLLAGQFSLTFGVAAALRFGTLDAQSYQDERFRDAELRRLEALVRVTRDGELTARRERGALLRVRTGEATTEVCVRQDDPALVLSEEGIVAKFAAGAAPGIAPERSRRFCDAWLSAPRQTPLAALWNAFP